MVICPEQSIFSAQKGIMLWANSIVPAMLPFFICINFIGGIGVLRVFPPGIFAFAMSIMSGYPMGPKIIGDMVRCNAVTHKKAVWLLSFCTLSGPAFMTATVGVSMLGDMKWGAVIAASHYLAAMANCIIFYIILRPSDEVQSLEYEQIKRGSLEIFTDSILQAFKSVGIILAYIIIFKFIYSILYKPCVFKAYRLLNVQTLCIFPCFCPYEPKQGKFLFSADYLIQQSCGSTLRFPCSVSVNIHCGTNISVSEKFLHIFRCCTV